MFLNQEYVTMEIGKVDIYEKNIKSFYVIINCFVINRMHENEDEF